MIQKIPLICLLCIFSLRLIALPIGKDSIAVFDPDLSTTVKTRSFKELDDVLKINNFNYQPETGEFDASYIKQNYAVDSTVNNLLSKARDVMDLIEKTQNYIDDLTAPGKINSLPIGIKVLIGHTTYILGITQAKITPQFTLVNAFLKITIPQNDELKKKKQELFFGADSIKISHRGGMFEVAKLVLLADVPIPINGGKAMIVLKGGFNKQTGNATELTYATVDCKGFKELSIDANLIFSRSMLVPLDENYNVIPDTTKKVEAHFKTIAKGWNDILAEVSFPLFQVAKTGSTKGKAGLIFEVNNAVFDYSDTRNSPGLSFPEGYQKYLVPGNPQLWQGVYVSTFSVTLPECFKKRGSDKRIQFKATDLIIDGMGVTGEFSVDNILPLNEGVASKWQFSVDHIGAKFLANEFIGASFGGRIVLPITSEVTNEELQKSDTTALHRKALSYKAIIDPSTEEYNLTVASPDTLSFNVFKARATLLPNSYIELKVSKNVFRPKAVLFGGLKIKGNNNQEDDNTGKAMVDFKGIEFQNLQLQTEAPYIKFDYLGAKGEVKFANFPITISDIGATANDAEVSLHFTLAVNLMEKGFGGSTTLSIVGSLKDNNNSQRWKFEGIRVDKISISGDMGPIKIKGSLEIKNNDPVYGDGFYGELDADFSTIKVNASAWFGKKEFRYWYVDAFVDFSGSPVKIYIGTLIINGFGGGAYYQMTRSSEPAKSSGVPSGRDYIPSADTGIGFRAVIGFALGNESALNGKVGFEMEFNNSGGVNSILFFGEAHMMKAISLPGAGNLLTKLNKVQEKVNSFGANSKVMQGLKSSNLVEYSKVSFPQDGLTFDVGIDANFSMTLDFKHKSFHAEMEVFVNTPGGIFTGIGEKGKVGKAVLHMESGLWYLYVGTPEDRIGLKVGIGGVGIKVTAYLMLGSKILDSPPPPKEVADILKLDMKELDYMRDLNDTKDGAGFAFGMAISVDTGDMTFLIFYASFKAGIGFDIMLKNYGNTECKGSGRIGVDGWYANGQAYVYLEGELGIHIKLFFVNKKISILKAGAAALLQAKLPNPAWFRGYLGGYYSVLNGLVKGRFRFKIELGKECEIVNGGPLDGLQIISEVKPADGGKGVDVFSNPEVAFNTKINEPFEFEDHKGVGTYRILLDEFSITEKGKQIVGDTKWNERKDVANFVSFDVLPPETNIKIKVAVSFQQKIKGKWETLKEDGKKATQTKEVTFTTGKAPDYIPLTNIAYTYPIFNQSYFYQNEQKKGYVKLIRGQAYLFSPATDWTQVVRFEGEAGTVTSKGVSYSESEKMVYFDFPGLANKSKFKLHIISISPPDKRGNVEKEIKYEKKEIGQADSVITIEIRNSEAQEAVKSGAESEVLAYDFTTSAYNTFAEKINAKQWVSSDLDPIFPDVHSIDITVQSSERFGLEELNGNQYTGGQPMIANEAVLDDDYYNSVIYPLIYKGYPLQPKFTVDRDVSVLGLPPKKGIEPVTWYSSYLENKPSDFLLNIRMPHRYYLAFYYKQDFIDIQYKIVNAHLKDASQYNYIINGSFPSIKTGDYKVKMQYIMPGNISGTSGIINFKNPFR